MSLLALKINELFVNTCCNTPHNNLTVTKSIFYGFLNTLASLEVDIGPIKLPHTTFTLKVYC